MALYEYRAIPAPDRGTRAAGAKGTAERFAAALTEALNAMAAEGWEYVRAESLPCVERKGLTGRVETTQTVLVFRRALRPRGAGRLADSPEAIAAAAAASLAPAEPRFAPALGAARRDAPPRPGRPLGPARED